MKISANFDGGNIDVVEISCRTTKLNIRLDNASEFYQWFYFKIEMTDLSEQTFIIENAGQASFADGFETFQACLSYDGEHWTRTQTQYDGDKLTITVSPKSKTFWLASFEPYSWDRHENLRAELSANARVNHSVVGHSIEGQPIDLYQIGKSAPGKKTVWITARQHPGEVMAEWWSEGLLKRLLDPSSRELLDECTVYVVPNMNPDGSRRGNLRTNAAGVNLNRIWGVSDLKHSPEVHHVSAKMSETGADIVLDIHGEEMIPFCFLAGGHGAPAFTRRLADLHDQFLATYMQAHTSMQADHGYPIPDGDVDLTIQTYWSVETFGCPAFTLEMPFGRDDTNPDNPDGWTAQSAMELGAAALPAIQDLLKLL